MSLFSCTKPFYTQNLCPIFFIFFFNFILSFFFVCKLENRKVFILTDSDSTCTAKSAYLTVFMKIIICIHITDILNICMMLKYYFFIFDAEKLFLTKNIYAW